MLDQLSESLIPLCSLCSGGDDRELTDDDKEVMAITSSGGAPSKHPGTTDYTTHNSKKRIHSDFQFRSIWNWETSSEVILRGRLPVWQDEIQWKKSSDWKIIMDDIEQLGSN